jgi:hypothetical protein
MENRVRNIGALAANTMTKALTCSRMELHEYDVWKGSAEFASIKAQARMAFRFAMRAVPVPLAVKVALFNAWNSELARHWNVRPPDYAFLSFGPVIGRWTARESNLRERD